MTPTSIRDSEVACFEDSRVAPLEIYAMARLVEHVNEQIEAEGVIASDEGVKEYTIIEAPWCLTVADEELEVA